MTARPGGCSPTRWPRQLLLAATRPWWYAQPRTTIRGISVQSGERVPRTCCRRAPRSSSRYRGIVEAALRQECPRRPTAGTEACFAAGIPPRPRAGSRRHRGIGEPAFGPGVSWAESTPRTIAGRRRGHSEVMTLRRFRDTADDAVRADTDVRGTLLSSATSVDRSDRPTRYPGRAAASHERPSGHSAASRDDLVEHDPPTVRASLPDPRVIAQALDPLVRGHAPSPIERRPYRPTGAAGLSAAAQVRSSMAPSAARARGRRTTPMPRGAKRSVNARVVREQLYQRLRAGVL